MKRWVMHVDMDAFFAAVEQLDHPAYRGKPVIVGGGSKRGVVSTCSYEARRYGVHSAMSVVQAQRLCPQGILVPPRMQRYVELSRQIRGVFALYSPCIEPLSIDEAFLEISGMEKLWPSPQALGESIKERIKTETGLTASVGIAPNKFLAKLASDLRKPDGLVLITAEEAESFIAPLPVSRMFGVGRQAQLALAQLGITTIGQLAQAPVAYLTRALGKQASAIQELARGIDTRPVETEREAKSLGRETTYEEDLRDPRLIQAALLDLSQQVGYRLRKAGLSGQTVTLKVKYSDFATITRSITGDYPLQLDEDIYAQVQQLQHKVNWQRPVRLLGVAVSHFQEQLPALLELQEDVEKQKRNAVLDQLKNKFGEHIIKRGT